MRRKRLWLAGLVLLTLVLALPLLLNLDAFHQQLHQALERELGRKVEFRSLSGQLLPRPGLIGRGVIVHERDEFGAEPFLYAEKVRCDLSLRTLSSMRLSFAGIHFHRPSINLVRGPEGAWNLATLLSDRVGKVSPGVLPVVSAAQGRVNFKYGVDKQLYALRAVRLRLAPQSDRGWRLDLEATPFRTDQRLAEMGELRLGGEVGQGAEFQAIPFKLDVSYAKASLAQLWSLAMGRELPLRATIAFNATLEGTPASWSLTGDTTVSNLRRWDLVGPPRNPLWQGDFDLTYATHGSILEVHKLLVRSEQSQVVVTGRVDDLLGARRWDLEANADLVFAELKEQYAALKANVADQLQLEGRVLAKLTLREGLENWTGELNAPADVAVKVPGMATAVQVSGLRMRAGGGRFELLPLTITFGPEDLLFLRGEISSFSRGFPYELEWTSTGVELDALRRTAMAFGWDLFGPSRWEGRAEIELESAGQLLAEAQPRWQGELRLQGVEYSPPELNQPLELVEARLRWQGARFEAAPVVVRLGDDTVAGSLRRRGRVERWSVEIEAERLNLDDLDQLVNPGRQGLLARLVGLRPRRETRWQNFSATGSVEIGELKAGPFTLRRFTGRGDWMEGFLELAELRFRAYGGRFRGRLQSDFRLSPPRHRLAGNLKQADLALLLGEATDWGELFTGMFGADLTLETQGSIPSELVRQLQGRVVGVVQDGTLNQLDLFSTMSAAADGEQAVAARRNANPTPLQSLAGEFRIADRQVQLDGARMITSRTALELSGSVSFDGRLDLFLRGEPLRVAGRRPTPVASRILSHSYTLSGTLARPRLALEEPLPVDSLAAP